LYPLLIVIVVLSLAGSTLAVFLAFNLVAQNGRILVRLEEMERRLTEAPTPTPSYPDPEMDQGLELGTEAPDFELPDLFGGRRSLSSLRGRPVLLVFFSPRCGYCLEMLPGLARLPWDHHGTGLAPLVVTNATAEENRKLVQEHGIRCPVLLQEGMEIAGQYQCNGTPMGYLIDTEGKIASPVAVGGQALLALANAPAAPAKENRQRGNKSLSESRIARDGLAAGTEAPLFTVPALTGGEVSLESYRGKPVLLFFSDPDCGPCMALAPEMEKRHRRGGPVQVLMVSRGTVEENQPKADEYGLTFPIGLQKRWEISQQYAMFGTPIGYLIGPDGKTVGDVAVGMESLISAYDNAPAALAAAKEALPMS
jgi:peroxiredoxin